jgi:hypothetical protein
LIDGKTGLGGVGRLGIGGRTLGTAGLATSGGVTGLSGFEAFPDDSFSAGLLSSSVTFGRIVLTGDSGTC